MATGLFIDLSCKTLDYNKLEDILKLGEVQ